LSNDLVKSYKIIKPAIVAVISRISTQPDFPEVIGTGFIVKGDGLIMTNAHVIEAIKQLPTHKSLEGEWPISVMVFHNEPGIGVINYSLEVDGVTKLSTPPSRYLKTPIDVGFIHVNCKNLPEASIEKTPSFQEGGLVATAGFPMGTDLLRAPGNVHQMTPTLRQGVVSAILPFPCDDPHAIMMDIEAMGGASGSPVFNPQTGEVLGILYGGAREPMSVQVGGQRGFGARTTGLSYAIPSNWLFPIMERYEQEVAPQVKHNEAETTDFKDVIAEGIKRMQAGAEGIIGDVTAVPATEIIQPKRHK